MAMRKRAQAAGKKKEPLLWTRPDIFFGGGEIIGASPLPTFPATGRENTKPSEGKRPDGGHYTVSQLAREWGLSPDKIRELFRNEPGVIKLQDENARKKRKRRYVTLRIPPEVAQRVARRIS
jgi:hypothetical protein